MSKTALITTEKKPSRPILIIDKEGKIGRFIVERLRNEFLIVFVSKKNINEENVISIPFVKKIPSIPDNFYSEIILVLDETQKQTIKTFQKKAAKDGIEISIIINIKDAHAKIVKEYLDFYDKTKILIIGEIFAKDFIFDSNFDINKLLIDASLYGRVEISNDVSKPQNPVYLQDALDAIIESVFVEEKQNLFYIYPQNSTTLLSLVLMLKKKNPGLKLDFVKKRAREKLFSPPQGGKYMLQNPYEYEDKIKKIDLEKIDAQIYLKEKKENKHIKINFLPILIFLITLILLPFVTTFLFLILGNFFAARNSFIALKSYEASSRTYLILKQELNFLGLREKINFDNYIFDKLASLQTDEYIRLSADNIKNVISGKSKNPYKELTDAILNYKNLYLINQQRFSSNNLDIFSPFLEFYPSILGFYNEKKYLILIQNSKIIWPSGGKIEYYGILRFNKGKIVGFKIYSAENLDKLLLSRVEPPFAIRRYLPSVNWYFKDSNFDVDFSKAAIASSIFLNSETHQDIDGVIAVDSFFIKDLLAQTGPVVVKDFNKSISSNNFMQVVQESIDKNIKGSFYDALFNKLSNISYKKIFELLSLSAEKKHLVFSFNDPGQQLAFSVNNLGSTLTDFREGENNDFFGVIETNFGGIVRTERNILQEIRIEDDGTIAETVSLDIKNLGVNPYKNYLRFILPMDTKLENVLINNIEQKIVPAVTDPSLYEAKNFNAPKGLEIENYSEGKNSIYGFFINVQPGKNEIITINYNLSRKLDNQGLYNLRIFKQPGTEPILYKLRISAPSYKTIEYPKNFSLTSLGVEAAINLDKDIDLNFKFSPR